MFLGKNFLCLITSDYFFSSKNPWKISLSSKWRKPYSWFCVLKISVSSIKNENLKYFSYVVVLTSPASVIQTRSQLLEKSVSHYNQLLLCSCVLGFPSCSLLGLGILGALGIPEVWMQVNSAVLHGTLYPEQEESRHSCISGRGKLEFHENVFFPKWSLILKW